MNRDLFGAIKAGKLDEVRRLLSLNPDLIHEKEDGLGPILIAAYHQEPVIADFIAEKSEDLTIFEAAATGRTAQIIHMLERDPALVNAYAEDGFQLLGLACFFGHYQTVEYLIKMGAQVNAPSRNPLKAAPIQSAAAAGQTKIVILLLNNGADPNVREQDGYTPLHAAAQNGDLEMIRALLNHGADMKIASQDGKLPIDLAKKAGHVEAAALLKDGTKQGFR
jgi:ankyrin repeat protein